MDVLRVARWQERLRQFASEREWTHFHTPKNLVMALAAEVGELLDQFRWLTPQESSSVMEEPDKARAVEDEVADVQIFLLQVADVLGINLDAAVDAKIRRNEDRYPLAAARGNARKHSELDP